MYLGPWPAGRRKPLPEVEAEYNRIIAELAAGGALPPGPEPAPST